MQLAVARHDSEESIALISAMLDAVVTPWDVSACPLYCHQLDKNGTVNYRQSFLPSLLSDLESNPDYDFMRDEPEFQKLFKVYCHNV